MCVIDLIFSSQRRLQSIKVSTIVLWTQVITVPSFKIAVNAVRVEQILSTPLNAATTVFESPRGPSYPCNQSGDWHSNAKERYPTTALQTAQVEFCQMLGDKSRRSRNRS